MIAVLARLQWMTLRGRVVRSVRLLRQPKYLVGFIIWSGWMALWVIRPMFRSRVGLQGMPVNDSITALLPTIHMIVALFVSLAMPFPWLLPWGRLGLPFREAELTMLLQAPLTRRQVIQYGLLKSEIGVFVSSLVISLIVARRGAFTFIAGLLGTWILFEFWHLNCKWRAMNNLRQTELPPVNARRRRLVLTAGVLAFYGALIATLIPFIASLGPALKSARGHGIEALPTGLSWPPLLAALLTPAKILTGAMFSAGAWQFLSAVIPGLALVIAQRELVLRSKARFEEGSLEQAKERETKKSPTRRFARLSTRSRAQHPFRLRRRGPQETALLWKNLLRVSRAPWRRLVLSLCALCLAVALLPALFRLHDITYAIVATVGATIMFMIPLLSGMTWNNDLRTELAHLELVRQWPVSPTRFVLGQVLSPAAPSFAASLFGSTLVLIGLFGNRLQQLITGAPPELDMIPDGPAFWGVNPSLAVVLIVVSALPVTAAVSFLSSALQNLVTILVPAWTIHTTDRTQGVAAFGQRMLFFWGLLLALVLAMIPSAILVGIAVVIQKALGIAPSAWAFPLWGVLAAVPIFMGGWMMVHVTAAFWERLDPSHELLEIGR